MLRLLTSRKKSKTEVISKVFTVSDEACAILMIINYLEWWRKMAEEPDKRKVKEAAFDAQFTSSCKGTRRNTWSDEGRKTFNEWCFKIAKL